MKKVLALLVIVTSFGAMASDYQRCFDNCMIVKKDKGICNFKCAMMDKNRAFTMPQEVAVDAQCFEELVEELGPDKAAQACPPYDYDLDIDYDHLID